MNHLIFKLILVVLPGCIMFLIAGCTGQSNARERDYILQPSWNARIPSATVRMPSDWTFNEEPDAPVSSTGEIYEIATAEYDPGINTITENIDSDGKQKPGMIAWVRFFYLPNIEGKSLRDCAGLTNRRKIYGANSLHPVDEDLYSSTDKSDRLTQSFTCRSSRGDEWVAKCSYIKSKDSNVVYGTIYAGDKDDYLIRQGDIDLIFNNLIMQKTAGNMENR